MNGKTFTITEQYIKYEYRIYFRVKRMPPHKPHCLRLCSYLFGWMQCVMLPMKHEKDKNIHTHTPLWLRYKSRKKEPKKKMFQTMNTKTQCYASITLLYDFTFKI